MYIYIHTQINVGSAKSRDMGPSAKVANESHGMRN